MKKIKKIGAFIFMLFATAILFSCSCSCAESEEAVRSLVISTSTVKVAVDEAFEISYTVAPTNAKVGGVFIKVSNERVVADQVKNDLHTDTVYFTAKQAGNSTITFTSQDGGRTQTCTVEVYKTTPLEIPKNLSFDGSTLSWSAVTKDIDGAVVPSYYSVKYELEITNVTDSIRTIVKTDELTFTQNANFSFEVNKVYDVKILALGNGVEFANSELSTVSCKFKTLTQPSFVVENGVVTWNTDRDVSHYILTYSQNDFLVIKYEQNSISFDLAGIEGVNQFDVKLQAVTVKNESDIPADYNGKISSMVEDIEFFSSATTSAQRVYRLVTPSDFTLLNNRVQNITIESASASVYGKTLISWQEDRLEVRGKLTYTITLSNKANGKSKEFLSTSASLEIGNEEIADLLGANVDSQIEITVKADAKTENKAELINSETSEPVAFIYYDAEVSQFNFSLVQGKLSFQQLSYDDFIPFSKYQFVFVNTTTNMTTVVETSNTEIDLTSTLSEAGTYNIYVFALGRVGVLDTLGIVNKLNFEKLGITFKTISAPVISHIFANGEVEWAGVDDADEYVVNLHYSDEVTLALFTTELQTSILDVLLANGYTYDDLQSDKSYTISVTSISDDAEFINAESAKVNFTKLVDIEDIAVEDGTLSWSVSGTNGYKVKINDSDWVDINPSVNSIPNILSDARFASSLHSGENVVSVIAIGQNSKRELHSSEKQVVILKALMPENVIVKSGVVSWDDGVAGSTYRLVVYNTQSQAVQSVVLQTPEFDLSVIKSTNLMYLTIQNINDSVFASDVTENVYFQRLPVPSIKVERMVDDYVFIWDKVENARGYTLSGIEGDTPEIVEVENRCYVVLDADRYEDATTLTLFAIDNFEYAHPTLSEPAYFFSESASLAVQKVSLPQVEISEGMYFEWSYSSSFVGYILEYELSLFKFVGDEYVYQTTHNLPPSATSYNFQNLEVGKYKVEILAVGSLVGENKKYVLNSDVTDFEFSKLNSVMLDVVDGKFVWKKTVEGESAVLGEMDSYLVYCESQLLSSSDYSLSYSDETNKVSLTFKTAVQNNKFYYVVTARDGHINSERSAGVKVQTVDVRNITKSQSNLSWSASITNASGVDLMSSYKMIIEHSTKSDSGIYYEEIIEANGANYNQTTKTYTISPLPNMMLAGEYKITIIAYGKLNPDGTAYLSDSAGYSTTVIRYSLPDEDSVFVADNILKIAAYKPASNNAQDLPKALEVEVQRANLDSDEYTFFETFVFSQASHGYTGAQVEFANYVDNLTAGNYIFTLKYLGDGGNYFLPSDAVAFDPIQKLPSTKTYIEEGKLYFEEVDAAEKYYIYLDDSTTPIIQSELEINTSAWLAKEYKVAIRATSSSAFWSSKSVVFSAVKLDKVANMEVTIESDDSWLNWSKIANATQYRVTKNIDEVMALLQEADINKWLIITDHSVGDHNFNVRSLGTVTTKVGVEYLPLGYVDSDIVSQKITFINPFVKPSQTDGLLKWTAGAGVVSSTVKVYSGEGFNTIVKEMATSAAFYNMGSIISEPGRYMFYVELKANGTTHIVSTHEDIVREGLASIKIDETFIENYSVQEGMLAYSISKDFIDEINALLGTVHVVDLNTIAGVLDGSVTNADIVQIVRSLITFNINVNGSVLENKKPTYALVLSDFNMVVLLFDLDAYAAGNYNIKLLSRGNNSTATVPAIMQGEWSEEIVVTKLAAPVCPALQSGALVEGKLVFESLPDYDGDYILYFQDVANSTNVIQHTVSKSDIEGINYYKTDENNLVEININSFVAAEVLSAGTRYKIYFSARGTQSSLSPYSGTIYLNGVKREVVNVFEALVEPSTFNVTNGALYWSRVGNAIGYELNFYKHISGDNFSLTPDETVEVVATSASSYSLSMQDKAEFLSGAYRVTITAIGEGNFIINSAPSAPLVFVKLGEVEVDLIDGILSWGAVYHEKVSAGKVDGSERVTRFRIQVEEIVSTTESKFSEWYTEDSLVTIDDYHYFELPEQFVSNNSKYRLKIYLPGNSTYLVSGDHAFSESYHRSDATSEIEMDENGLISWKRVEERFVVFVEGSPLLFGADMGYTPNNFFNINDYYHNNAGTYSVYMRSVNSNSSDEKLIRSVKSLQFDIRIINAPTLVLNEGVLDFSGGVYEEYKEHLTASMMKIVGTFFIDGEKKESVSLYVRSGIDISQLTNKTYYVNEQDADNAIYTLNRMEEEPTNDLALNFIEREKYNVQIKFVGYSGEIDTQGTYLASTKYEDSEIKEVEVLPPPSQISSANEDFFSDDYYNFVKWNAVTGATKYIVEFFHYKQDEQDVYTSELIEFLTIDTSHRPELFFGSEGDGYVYFTIDSAILAMSEMTLADKTITIKVTSVGTTTGVHTEKFATSVASSSLAMNFPEAPTNIAYNTVGQISWQNKDAGTVFIEVVYDRFSEYIADYLDFINYSNITRTHIGANVYKDRIVIEGSDAKSIGLYKLQYLTGKISSISVQLYSLAGYYSVVNKISMTTNNSFASFQNGDGSVDAPFVVSTKSHLTNINYYLESNFMLGANITTDAMKPIGSEVPESRVNYEPFQSFTGTLNGAGYTINLILSTAIKDDKNYAGLFYLLSEDVEIKNLNISFKNTGLNRLVGASTELYVGGVAYENAGRIFNTTLSGDIIFLNNNNSQVSAAVGLNTSTGQLERVVSTTNITYESAAQDIKPTSVASLAVENRGLIFESGANASLVGIYVGGLVCDNFSVVERSYFRGNLLSDAKGSTEIRNAYVGGMVAYAGEGSVIRDVYVVASVAMVDAPITSNRYIGGIVAVNTSTNSTLVSAFAAISAGARGINSNPQLGIIAGFQTMSLTDKKVYYINSIAESSYSGVSGKEDAASGTIAITSIDESLVINLSNELFELWDTGEYAGSIKLKWE